MMYSIFIDAIYFTNVTDYFSTTYRLQSGAMEPLDAFFAARMHRSCQYVVEQAVVVSWSMRMGDEYLTFLCWFSTTVEHLLNRLPVLPRQFLILAATVQTIG